VANRKRLHAALDAVFDYYDALHTVKRAYDEAEFKESEHPRKADGKFGKGAGGAGTTPADFPKGSHTSGAGMAKAMLNHGAYSNEQIAQAVKAAFGTKVTPGTIAQYKKEIEKSTPEGAKAEAAKNAGIEHIKELITKHPNADNASIVNLVNGKFGTKFIPAAAAFYKHQAYKETPEGKAALAAKKAGVKSNDTAIKTAAEKPVPQAEVDASYKKAEEAASKTVYVSAKDSDGKPQYIKLSGVPDGLDNSADLKETLKKKGLTVSVVGAFDPAKPAPPGGYKDIALHPHDAELAKTAKYAKQEADAKAAAESKSADAPITELHAKLTHDEVKAIKAYTDGAYKALNQQLRRGQPMTPEQYTTAAQLDTALAKAKITKDTFVYRGLGDAAEKFFGPEPVIGTIIIDNGYISTAKTKEKAWGGAKCSIAVKKGQKGMDVQSRSLHPGEKEVMLPRGSMFKITGVKSGGMVELEYVNG
jgi:hypothetical protein